MSYCINPNCYNRQNPDELESCQACRTKLLINERYQIVQPLRVWTTYSEVFEVKDLDERTLKVLKSLSIKPNTSKSAELFEKEAQVLIWLSSEWQKHPGIPKVKPDGYFTVGLGNNGFKKLQCLVMEKIEGQDLEKWLEQNQPISQDQAINWLRQLVEILDKVHQQGLWHRDIKPSNIMLKPDGQLVLIDFGSVGVGQTIIVSVDYTPPEQIEGKTALQSDFFALGRTFVYLVTGKHPHELPKASQTEQLLWQDKASQISPQFAKLIDKLIAPSPKNRPQTTQEILQCLNLLSKGNEQGISQLSQLWIKVKNQRLKNSIKVGVVGGAILLAGLTVNSLYNVVPCQMLGNLAFCLPAHPNHLSSGRAILVPGSTTPEKLAGVKAIASGRYAEAVALLEQARKIQRNDPETLIYLNNARIEAKQAKAYTIAVVAPLDSKPDILHSGLEILRGVAQAQDEVNQGKTINGISLKVLIADDRNEPAQAKKIAENLVANNDVLGVIGHFTSDITLAVTDIYQQNQLVLVSPTSTSDEFITKSSAGQSNFFFRTVPSDRVTAQALTSYLLNQAHQHKAAVFYNPKSIYSLSLRNQLGINFSSSGGKVIEEFDLSSLLFNAGKAIDKAEKQGATAFILLPDSTTRAKALEVIQANSHRHSIVGGDSVYNPDILNIGKEATGLVVAIPWQNSRSPNLEFTQAAQNLWGGSVSWRTALAYDATRALLTALEKQAVPSRISLQQALAEPNFSTNGATGVISFRANGDRKEPAIQLVKVVLDKQGKLVFSPLY